MATPSSSSLSVKTPTSASTSAYEFPSIYHFPPSYTLQPNLTTRASQLSSWSAIVLSYAAAHRLFRIHAAHSIFTNTKLNRTFAQPDARILLASMVTSSQADPVESLTPLSSAAAINTYAQTDGKRKGAAKEQEEEVWLWWKTPEEWASLILEWIDKTGQRGSILTFYELLEGEAAEGEEFWGLPREMLGKIAAVLVRRAKAAVVGEGEGLGVKVW